MSLPDPQSVAVALHSLGITEHPLSGWPYDEFRRQLDERFDNGGCLLAAFHVPENELFDWLAEGNRLGNEGVLSGLLENPHVRAALPSLEIALPLVARFRQSSAFDIDCMFAYLLYHGGAYWKARGSGQAEKRLALAVCKSLFDLRYGDLYSLHATNDAWCPWFIGGPWDLTLMFYDRRERTLVLVCVTDAD